MKVTSGSGPLDTYVVMAEVAEYDAHPPIPTISMDYTPKLVNRDRFALAAYLLFRPWMSGVLTLELAAQPALVQTIADLERPRWLTVEPVELRARDVVTGTGSASVALLDQATTDSAPIRGKAGVLELGILRSDQATGVLRTNSAVLLASNAFVLADTPDRELEVAAAVACLMAEDLNLGRLDFPLVSASAEARGRLSRLLDAVGLVLQPRS